MKKYIHKLSGEIYMKLNQFHYRSLRPIIAGSVPAQIVEAEGSKDWEEIPEQKPVVTLQGKDLYEWDYCWQVISRDDWEISPHIVSFAQSSWDYNITKYFATKELAEQYVRDNKPAYPAGLVNDLLDAVKGLDGWYPFLDSVIIKLKAFKK